MTKQEFAGTRAMKEAPAWVQWTVFAAAGIMMGLSSLLGWLICAGAASLLAMALAVKLFGKLYHRLWLCAIVLLACVFIEPSPTDALVCALLPVGLLTGSFRVQPLGKAFPAFALLCAYSVASLPGIAAAVDFQSAVRYYLITSYLFIFSVFLCMYANPGNITSILRAYVIAALISFAAGFLGLLGFFPSVLIAFSTRIKGLFKDPNVFGPFFIPAILFLMDDWKRRSIFPFPRAVHAIGIALMTLGVIYSYSRAAWISLAAAVFLYLFMHIRSIRPAVLIRIAIGTLAAVAVITLIFCVPAVRNSGFVDFILQRAQLQDYDSNRFASQQGGFQLTLRHPLGIGPGQFETEIRKVTGKDVSAHSLYIRTLTENGAAGGLLFIAAMLCLLAMLWFRRRAPRPGGIVPAGSSGPAGADPFAGIGVSPAALIAVLSGILVNSLVVDTLHWRHFWFVIGLAMYFLKEWGKQAVPNE